MQIATFFRWTAAIWWGISHFFVNISGFCFCYRFQIWQVGPWGLSRFPFPIGRHPLHLMAHWPPVQIWNLSKKINHISGDSAKYHTNPHHHTRKWPYLYIETNLNYSENFTLTGSTIYIPNWERAVYISHYERTNSDLPTEPKKQTRNRCWWGWERSNKYSKISSSFFYFKLNYCNFSVTEM